MSSIVWDTDISVLLVFVIVFLSLIWIARKPFLSRRLPPGPRPFPIIGNIFQMKGGNLREAFDDFRMKYGNVNYFRLGASEYVVVNGYEAIRDLFVRKGNLVFDRPRNYQAKVITKFEGIIMASGKRSKEHRVFSMSALRGVSFGNRDIEGDIMKEVDVLLDIFLKYKSEPFNPQPHLKVATSNIVSSMAFGQRFEHDDNNFLKLLKSLDDYFKNTHISVILTVFPFLRYLPGDLFNIKKKIQYRNHLIQIMKRFVDEHKLTYNVGAIRDYIDLFLQEMEKPQQENSSFTESQLLMSLGDLFLAGAETTATVLTWAIVFLINHPDVQTKLRAELDTVVGTSRSPRLKDRQNLPYTEAVITEILRRGSVAPFAVPHTTTSDLEFQGFIIPKGASIFMNLLSVMFDPEIFPEPNRFDPTRFLDGKVEKCVNTEKVIPFGVGKRVCVGEHLARSEIFLFLTSLVQRFQFLPEFEDIPPSMELVIGLTASPKSFNFRAIERQ